jgi:hypothetical protein
MRFFTHDNGNRPFLVKINKAKKYAEIFKRDPNEEPQYENETYKDSDYPIEVMEFEFLKVWIGDAMDNMGRKDKIFLGNTILFQISEKEYIFVGHEIGKFKLNAPVQKYVSIVGNSNVPYPWFVSNGYFYLILANARVPIPEDWNWNDDPYNWYWFTKKPKGRGKTGKWTKQHREDYFGSEDWSYKIVHPRI